MITACVTGGAGFIGRILAENLLKSGVSTRLLTRRKAGRKERYSYFEGDLTDENSSLKGLMDGVDVVFHCAGEVINDRLMRILHVDGTKHLLDEVRAQIEIAGKPLHWVQLSSVGTYGPPQGPARSQRVVDETTPQIPCGEYEVTKTIADELVREFAKSEPLFTYSILRPSNVIGPTMTNQSLRAMIKMVKKKLFFYIGSRSAIATYIHVNDVVDALMLCGIDPRAHGQIFNLSNDCELSEIVNAIAIASKLPVPNICIPEAPLRLIVRFLSMFITTPLTQERIDALVKRTHYSTEHIEKTLGFVPKYPIPASIASMFEERLNAIET